MTCGTMLMPLLCASSLDLRSLGVSVVYIVCVCVCVCVCLAGTCSCMCSRCLSILSCMIGIQYSCIEQCL